VDFVVVQLLGSGGLLPVYHTDDFSKALVARQAAQKVSGNKIIIMATDVDDFNYEETIKQLGLQYGYEESA
jgi:hypothetical protein